MLPDKNGRDLEENSLAFIPVIVTALGEPGEFANVSVCTRECNPQDQALTPIVLNSRQIVLDPQPPY